MSINPSRFLRDDPALLWFKATDDVTLHYTTMDTAEPAELVVGKGSRISVLPGSPLAAVCADHPNMVSCPQPAIRTRPRRWNTRVLPWRRQML